MRTNQSNQLKNIQSNNMKVLEQNKKPIPWSSDFTTATQPYLSATPEITLNLQGNSPAAFSDCLK